MGQSIFSHVSMWFNSSSVKIFRPLRDMGNIEFYWSVKLENDSGENLKCCPIYTISSISIPILG